ncbi:hypothetical protein Ahy_A09g045981 [Arachis hypogaea]|uniref:Aminotransferase-like plant mobile domain-containing protein n=1 Tax=Arachis hypogaea TaxID=3818 RepID=A0A445BNK7_ARAHY|nr:hypothetical protein Ahy_A09g045981 [Arachis hypogaea]
MHLYDRIIPYLERVGLYHLPRLNTRWFWLDESLVSTFIERWHPETHTFHMPFGECSIMLQDMAYQLGLPVDGKAISGCLTDFEKVLLTDATEDTVRLYARAYIMMLLSTQLFGDKSANWIVWEPYAALDMLAVVHPDILAKEHSRLRRAITSLIYFAVIE